jgi:hypothetical protein
MKRKASFLYLAMFLAFASPARAAVITLDKNVDVINTLALSTVSMLTDTFGFERGLTFHYEGTYSDTEWSFTIAGQLGLNDISIDFVGTFDPVTEMGSFTSAGANGAFSWSGTGDYVYLSEGLFDAILSADWETVVAGLDGRGGPVIHGPDRRIIGRGERRLVDEDDRFEYYEQTITFEITEFGKPVGTEEEVKQTRKRKPRPPAETPHGGDGGGGLDREDEETGIPGRTHRSEFQFEAGQISGDVNTVPEPLTMLLLGAGIAVYAKRRWSA